jgi:hypothetical protein
MILTAFIGLLATPVLFAACGNVHQEAPVDGGIDAGVCGMDTCGSERSDCIALLVERNGTATCKCYCLSSDAGGDAG